MDQEIRNKLRNVVTQCRKLLEDSISQELEGKYGIFAKKDHVTADPNASMSHLTVEEQGARKDILDHFGHIKARGFKPKEALDQLVREIAFTHLNRLCAYKMMEAREVYVGGQKFREAVSRGINSNGVKFYLADHPEEERLFNTGHQDIAYRRFLDWLGGLLSDEIGVLFNPNDPANRLYPRQKTLDEVLDLLNGGGIKPDETELREGWPKIWSQDETIGWVYQYFTPKELRDAARDPKKGGSAAPRNSYELAFRNQFFTPRYVVEFLTDNTLGRTWYEMRKGNTKLAETCRFLVRRKHPVFLEPGQRPPEPFAIEDWVEVMKIREMWTPPPGEDADLQQIWRYAHTADGYEFSKTRFSKECGDLANERLKDYRRSKEWIGTFEELRCCLYFEQRRWRHFGGDPDGEDLTAIKDLYNAMCERWKVEVEFVVHRPKKDPRNLKILDPACGSGHFLLYCFDLLQTIYEEAYADPDLGPALKTDHPSLEDLRRNVPRLILACNLHGIDIDLRASQIAALALWLRCQRAYRDIGLKKDHPKITRSNFVCAEPMPGEEQMLKEFVGQLEPKLLGQIVEVVFEKMKLAGDAGSLLKIEGEIRGAVAEAKRQWAQETIRATDRKGQPLLFSKATMERLVGKPEQAGLFDLGDITDEQFFEEAETKVIEALRQYAEKADNGHRLQRRLFTEDAVRGFAFVDLCHKRFDVVLMNPPFGLASKPSQKLIDAIYPMAKYDLYAASITRGLGLLEPSGALGAITNRTGFFLSDFTAFRESVMLGSASLSVIADLGEGVLDGAKVATAAYSLWAVPTDEESHSCWIRVLENSVGEKGESLLRSVGLLHSPNIFVVRNLPFTKISTAPLAYWVSESVRTRLAQAETFEPAWGIARTGLQGLGADDIFIRGFWEVPQCSLGKSRRWVPFAKGGKSQSWHLPPYLVTDWENDGERQRDFAIRKYGSVTRKITGIPLFFKAGLTYTAYTNIGFRPRVLPADCIFSLAGSGIFTKQEQLLDVLAYLNSAFVQFFLRMTTDGRKWDPGYIKRVPVPVRPVPLSEPARRAIACCRAAAEREECNRDYQSPWAGPVHAAHSVVDLLNSRIAEGLRSREELQHLQTDIDARVTAALGLGATELVQLQSEIVRFTSEDEAAVDEKDSEEETDFANEASMASTAQDICSYSLGCAVGRWDIRHVTNDHCTPIVSDPFAPLPLCSPGMLQDVDGRPARTSPNDYPLRVRWDGIIPDDTDHPNDIVCSTREAFDCIWRDRAENIEKEICQIFRVDELRSYFRKPGKGGFWLDHVSRYSKSPRKAPIYWLLQSTNKNYGLWLYYHRLDKDLLFKALVNYVEPKIRLETSRLETFRSQKAAAGDSGKEGKRLAKEIERQEDFLSELRDFEDKLRRVAELHLEPDLNDGVVLNIAPLRELVPWKEAKRYWEELLDGKYEWSSIGKQLHQKGLVK